MAFFGNNGGNNGGGNPNHDENGRFTSANGASSKTEEVSSEKKKIMDMGFSPNEEEQRPTQSQEVETTESDDEIIDRSLNNMIEKAKKAGIDNPKLNKWWASELRNQLKSDGVPEDQIDGLARKFISRMNNQEIQNMGFAPAENSTEDDDVLEDIYGTEDYANMVLDDKRSIPYYADEGQDWQSRRNQRKEMLAIESTEKLQKMKSEINGIARNWATKAKRKKVTNDEKMALKSLIVDINMELDKRGL